MNIRPTKNIPSQLGQCTYLSDLQHGLHGPSGPPQGYVLLLTMPGLRLRWAVEKVVSTLLPLFLPAVKLHFVTQPTYEASSALFCPS